MSSSTLNWIITSTKSINNSLSVQSEAIDELATNSAQLDGLERQSSTGLLKNATASAEQTCAGYIAATQNGSSTGTIYSPDLADKTQIHVSFSIPSSMIDPSNAEQVAQAIASAITQNLKSTQGLSSFGHAQTSYNLWSSNKSAQIGSQCQSSTIYTPGAITQCIGFPSPNLFDYPHDELSNISHALVTDDDPNPSDMFAMGNYLYIVPSDRARLVCIQMNSRDPRDWVVDADDDLSEAPVTQIFLCCSRDNFSFGGLSYGSGPVVVYTSPYGDTNGQLPFGYVPLSVNSRFLRYPQALTPENVEITEYPAHPIARAYDMIVGSVISPSSPLVRTDSYLSTLQTHTRSELLLQAAALSLLGEGAEIVPGTTTFVRTTLYQSTYFWILYRLGTSNAFFLVETNQAITSIRETTENIYYAQGDNDGNRMTYYLVQRGTSESIGGIIPFTYCRYTGRASYEPMWVPPTGSLLYNADNNDQVTSTPSNLLFNVSQVNGNTILISYCGAQATGQDSFINVVLVNKGPTHTSEYSYVNLASISMSLSTTIPRFSFCQHSLNLMLTNNGTLWLIKGVGNMTTNSIQIVPAARTIPNPLYSYGNINLAVDSSLVNTAWCSPVGTSEERPSAESVPIGSSRFNTELQCPEWLTESGWRRATLSE